MTTLSLECAPSPIAVEPPVAIWLCPECFSPKIQGLVWADLNHGKLIEDGAPVGPCWCPHCENAPQYPLVVDTATGTARNAEGNFSDAVALYLESEACR